MVLKAKKAKAAAPKATLARKPTRGTFRTTSVSVFTLAGLDFPHQPLANP